MTRTDPADVPRPDAQLHLGVFFQGVNHWTIWSDPASGSQIHPDSYRRVAQTAERGLFDAFFLGEGLRLREVGGRIHDLDVAGRPDAVTQLAALAAQTDRIGLVSTTNTTFNEPADLARRLAGLDLLSDGRAGWNVVTTDNAWTGENFRRGGYLDHAERYVRAEQFLAAARAIWDGQGDLVRVRSSQFSIDVRPSLPRSRQGHPVIFQAGDSGAGRDFAARNADVIFSAHGTDFDDALAFAADIRARLRAAGRPEDDIRILPGTSIVIGATEAEAEEKAAWVRREQITPATALAQASLVWSRDLSDHDPDGPLPKVDPLPPDDSGAFGSARVRDADAIVRQWREQADANGWSLRDTVINLGQRTRGHVGTPAGLADKFGRFVREGAIDGFNVSPYLVPHGLDDIVEQLVPALQERGLYRTVYTGTTLREHLGLRPAAGDVRGGRRDRQEHR
ncbi:LLM class flavin-dependent oxidoreductase [Dactylosporangium vinaceum]|uniref:LLM class flavin-dependent oxidoreductase n=1 Tax=Dactylosporangium vinaceum TaxID=53362 RepID=A0ABV5M2U8_9ACTN|nr:LLM class flavin-dependent oxidoreductase [Dactylosporangium vinaceum]UAB99875.1 LLM class flavin-dependent oxidoreductase [Dactylosporangium vinaceum]